MTTPPSPNPTPLPALAMVAALVFAVGAIATVFVFDRDPELFRSRGSTAVSHTRQGRRPTRLPTRRGTAWTGTASSCGGCPPKGFSYDDRTTLQSTMRVVSVRATRA